MYSAVRLIVCLLLMAVAIAGEAKLSDRSEGGTDAKHPMGRHLPGMGIRNFGEVTPMLYRGGQPSHAGLQTLAHMGVDIVVNNSGRQNDDEGKDVEKLGMRYVVIRWHCPIPQDKAFVRFLKLIEDNPGKKIFVHCRLGDDRTGMMIAAYRMAMEGWSAGDAMKEMHEFGFARWHYMICPLLGPYERHFPEHFKHSHAFDKVRSEQKSAK